MEYRSYCLLFINSIIAYIAVVKKKQDIHIVDQKQC